MGTKLTHRAKLYAMELTIFAMRQARNSGLLSSVFRQVYHLASDGRLIVWGCTLLAIGLGGFLIGYLSFFIIPR